MAGNDPGMCYNGRMADASRHQSAKKLAPIAVLAVILAAGTYLLTQKSEVVVAPEGGAGGSGATSPLFSSDAGIGAGTAFSSSTPAVKVSVADLIASGFRAASPQPPTPDGDYQKAQYFWVNDAANGATSTANLLMVSEEPIPPTVTALYAYGATSTDIALPGATGKEWPLTAKNDSRTALNFIKHGLYVVIIGPGDPIERLANLLASEIQ